MNGLATAYLVLAALAGPQPFASPARLLASLYQFYENQPRGLGRSPFADDATIGRYFTSRFGSSIIADQRWSAAHGEVGCIDFDPVVQAQDYRLTKLKIRIKPARPAARSVAAKVSFDNIGRATTVYFTLVKSAAGWKIDDLRGSRGASFRHYLETCTRKLPK